MDARVVGRSELGPSGGAFLKCAIEFDTTTVPATDSSSSVTGICPSLTRG